MKMTQFFLDQLKREAAINRRALGVVPEGKNAWKPHPKSMPLGYLAALVATMPGWIAMMIEQDELDLAKGERQSDAGSVSELVEMLDRSVTAGEKALQNTDDAHLQTRWRLLYAGRVMDDRPRHAVIADTFAHMAHHRGQLTVYLRLNDRPIPSIYGPTADAPLS